MDIWRTGFVRASLEQVIANGGIDGLHREYLAGSDRPFTFLADPFGVSRCGKFHIFVEAFDYRDRRGWIEVHTLSQDGLPLDRHTCLSEPWHLSYPFPIAWDGEDYLLPEAHRSGRLTLYRAVEFPRRWERLQVLDLPHVAVDATPVFYGDRWWLFYTPAGAEELHVAMANHLRGPWHAHPAGAGATGLKGSRPGGTPLIIDGKMVLPVQDCSRTYGGAIRALTFHVLTGERIEAELGEPILAPNDAAPFNQGLHTLSACGPLTLFDIKRCDHSLAARLTGFTGKIRRAFRQSGARYD